MLTTRILLLVTLFTTLACETEPETIGGGASAVQDAEENNSSSSQSSQQNQETDAVDNGFYEISGARPDEVCGAEGFRYLAEGYLFAECGGCHFQDNQFGVTEFAVKSDLDYSFQVFSRSVNKALFVGASIENEFCKTCILEEEDPLLADIRYLAEHFTDAQCELSGAD